MVFGRARSNEFNAKKKPALVVQVPARRYEGVLMKAVCPDRVDLTRAIACCTDWLIPVGQGSCFLPSPGVHQLHSKG